MMKIYFAFLSLALACMTACQDGPQLKTAVSGKAGEVVVVYDKVLWDTSFTKEVDALLAPVYPALPQRELMFNIIDIPAMSFSNIFEIHRNLIFIQATADTVPAQVTVRHNIWAQPQTVVRINGANSTEILSLIQQEQERVLHILEQAERDRVINNSKKYEAKSIRNTLDSLFGGSPYFPAGYVLMKKNNDFAWVAYAVQKAQLGVFMYKYPYKDTTSFRTENIIAQRNAMLKREVPGQAENSYMTTASLFPTQSRNLLYNNIHFVETRGLWDLENDFMGGPFISHSFIDQTGKNIIVLEAFVYHPSGEKRNFLRQVESIIYSFEWKESQQDNGEFGNS